jgi:hypothetical protein
MTCPAFLSGEDVHDSVSATAKATAVNATKRKNPFPIGISIFSTQTNQKGTKSCLIHFFGASLHPHSAIGA